MGYKLSLLCPFYFAPLPCQFAQMSFAVVVTKITQQNVQVEVFCTVYINKNSHKDHCMPIDHKILLKVYRFREKSFEISAKALTELVTGKWLLETIRCISTINRNVNIRVKTLKINMKYQVLCTELYIDNMCDCGKETSDTNIFVKGTFQW